MSFLFIVVHLTLDSVGTGVMFWGCPSTTFFRLSDLVITISHERLEKYDETYSY